MSATALTVGRMQDFNPDKETIWAYLKRFLLYVSVNGIAEAKWVSMLLLVIGMTHYSLLRGLVSPAEPEEKAVDKLMVLLKITMT